VGSSLAEVQALKAQNEELLDHVQELESDLHSSDADLEQAIHCLEKHGISFSAA
jgi:hypothetical protein